MLWQAVTSARLWGEATDFEIFMRMRSKEPLPAPSSVKEGVPEALDRVCARALAMRVEDRYATAAEMLADLETWLETVPAASGPSAGPKALATLLLEHFEAQRRATRAEIERQIKETPTSSVMSAVDVPVLSERVPAAGNTGSTQLGLEGTKL